MPKYDKIKQKLTGEKIMIQSTGIVRSLDDLGRVVLPKELRERLEILEEGAALEVFIDENMILLRKYQPGCIFCGSISDVEMFRGKRICPG